MLFEEKFLIKNGGQYQNFSKNDFVFREGDKAQFFYWLAKGEIHLYNNGAEGKEFLQMRITEGHCFGEPALLLDLPYPASATVVSNTSEVIRIKKSKFHEMMLKNPEILLKFTTEIAKKAYDKTIRLHEIVYSTPESRILKALFHYKEEKNLNNQEAVIPFTRKELAHTTGLCIETVIRTVKKLEKSNHLKIINRKIHI